MGRRNSLGLAAELLRQLDAAGMTCAHAQWVVEDRNARLDFLNSIGTAMLQRFFSSLQYGYPKFQWRLELTGEGRKEGQRVLSFWSSEEGITRIVLTFFDSKPTFKTEAGLRFTLESDGSVFVTLGMHVEAKVPKGTMIAGMVVAETPLWSPKHDIRYFAEALNGSGFLPEGFKIPTEADKFFVRGRLPYKQLYDASGSW